MPIAREPGPGQVPPDERPANLHDYEGQWVAVLHGKVIASADDDRQLAHKLRQMGADGENAAMQYIRPPVAGYVIGVG